MTPPPFADPLESRSCCCWWWGVWWSWSWGRRRFFSLLLLSLSLDQTRVLIPAGSEGGAWRVVVLQGMLCRRMEEEGGGWDVVAPLERKGREKEKERGRSRWTRKRNGFPDRKLFEAAADG